MPHKLHFCIYISILPSVLHYRFIGYLKLNTNPIFFAKIGIFVILNKAPVCTDRMCSREFILYFSIFTTAN